MLRNFCFVFTVFLALWPVLGRAAQVVVVNQIDLERHGDRLNARVRLETPAKVSAFLLPAPQPRLVLDLPAALVLQGRDLAMHGTQQHPLALVRFARRSPTQTRIVFDLPAQGADMRIETHTVDGFVEVVASTRLTGAPAAFLGAAEPKASPRQAPLGQPATYRASKRAALIVLDAGHGGRDPGASTAAGDQEKSITLSAALELRSMLEAKGFAVRLTREDDTYVSLDERVERARDWGGDLFLSLHADAAGNATVSGASVYTLSDRGGRRARRYRFAKDWAEDASDPVISDIVFELTQQNSVDQSSQFAEALLRTLDGTVPITRNARRSAGFYVLQAPEVPAVLLEMGFLTNPEDAKRLQSPQGRSALLKAVVRAIDEHFAARTLLAQSNSGSFAP